MNEDSEKDVELSTKEDPLLSRLEAKHAELRLNHMMELQKSLEMEHSYASKKMQKLPPSLDLLSDEITLALNDIAARCEEYSVPQVGQLLKDVRVMMNQQLREAYSSIEAGYKSAFQKLEETEGMRRQREVNKTPKEDENSIVQQSQKKLNPSGGENTQKTSPSFWCRSRMYSTASKTITVKDTFLTTLSFFAEMTAVLLQCEVVRIFLYDEHESLRCCARFPFNTNLGDPMTGNDLELMLAKEIHSTVCRKCIAVNGREAQHITLSERDRAVMEDELQQTGWKSMTSCLIFPILSSNGCGRSYGMIHAVNKQGISVGRPGVFDENDEVFMSITARLLGCLLTRYPVKYFVLSVGQKLRQPTASQLTRFEGHHLPALVQDEVKGAAKVGNKANHMFTRVLLYRAPINVIYQTRSLRKKARKLEVLNIVDKALSTVEFDIAALEELWRAGYEENIMMYDQCKELNEEVNALQILLRNVLDGIGASRTINNMRELTNYLQILELYARQENITLITQLISQVLLNSGEGIPVPPELENVSSERLSPDERIRMERRIAQTPLKLKFGAASPANVCTYSCDPEKRREEVRFFDQLAKQRELGSAAKPVTKRIPRYELETQAALAKKIKQTTSAVVQFGPTDYASKRPFLLGDIK